MGTQVAESDYRYSVALIWTCANQILEVRLLPPLRQYLIYCHYTGYWCMHLAAAHGKASVLQAIIKTGVNINAVDKRRWTIMHHAAYHGRLNVLQVSL